MKSPMTPRGYNKLREELQKLKSMRPELAQAIAVARSHGDLSENADYDAAKNNSGLVEAKIRSIEAILANAQVINPIDLNKPEKVCFGVTVKICDLDSNEEKIYSIYGAEESDASKGWISFDTPLARSIMNKAEGDVIIVQLPGGKREYEILEISVDYSE